MKVLLNIVIVAAFCTCALGAAGLNTVPEDQRWHLFGAIEMTYPQSAVSTLIVGLIAMGAAGIAQRVWRSGLTARGSEHTHLDSFLQAVRKVRDAVGEIEHVKDAIEGEELAERIDRLLANEYFDLTSRHEELVELIGFSQYAAVWEGVAQAERRLARVWSMTVDGHPEESLGEVTVALQRLEETCRRLDEVVGDS